MKTWLAVIFLLGCSSLAAQDKRSVVIGLMADKPNALLIVNPQHSDQGVLLPQLSTTQRTAMNPSSPDEDGLIVFDTDLGTYFYWSRGEWVALVKRNPTKLAFQSLDPANFVDLKSGNNSRHSNLAVFQSDNTFVTVTREGRGEIISPIELPHGVSIRQLTIYYLDNDEENLQVRLLRQAFTGESDTLISWESSGSSPSVNVHALEDFNDMEPIDREKYSYRLIVTFDNDEEVRSAEDARQRLYGVGIKYQEQ